MIIWMDRRDAHTEVAYFPIMARPEVFYSSYATAVCQPLHLFIIENSTSPFFPHPFIATFNVVEHLQNRMVLLITFHLPLSFSVLK